MLPRLQRNSVLCEGQVSYSKVELQAFRDLAHKGPVPNCEGCKRKADAAMRLLNHLFLEHERRMIVTARAHALWGGEGRGEFDRVMGAILDRLQVNSEAVPRGSKKCDTPCD